MNHETVRRNTYLAGKVKRYHSWPTLREQTVAEHTHDVMRIYIEIFGPPPPEVTAKIVYHDLPEISTGDPPFGVKKVEPVLKEAYGRMDRAWLQECVPGWVLDIVLDEAQSQMIKICDLLEMTEFGLLEMSMGNQFGTPVVDVTSRAVIEMLRSRDCMLSDEQRVAVTDYMEKIL